MILTSNSTLDNNDPRQLGGETSVMINGASSDKTFLSTEVEATTAASDSDTLRNEEMPCRSGFRFW